MRPSDLRLTRCLLLITSLFIALNLPTYIFRCLEQFAPHLSFMAESHSNMTGSSFSFSFFPSPSFLVLFSLFYPLSSRAAAEEESVTEHNIAIVRGIEIFKLVAYLLSYS